MQKRCSADCWFPQLNFRRYEDDTNAIHAWAAGKLANTADKIHTKMNWPSLSWLHIEFHAILQWNFELVLLLWLSKLCYYRQWNLTMDGFTEVDKCEKETKIIAVLTFTAVHVCVCCHSFTKVRTAKTGWHKYLHLHAHTMAHTCSMFTRFIRRKSWTRAISDVHKLSNDLAVQQNNFLSEPKFYVIDDKSWWCGKLHEFEE